jgi:hypothetical protein
VHPEALEVCNGLDDDCVQGADNVGRSSTWYPDEDGDGLGVAEGAVQAACPPGPAWSQEPGDCDDSDKSVVWECDTTGCSCQQAPGGPGMALVLLLGVTRGRARLGGPAAGARVRAPGRRG